MHSFLAKHINPQVTKAESERPLKNKIKDAINPEYVLRFVISSEIVDRDKDVVVQDGIGFSYFKSNPVVLTDHNYGVDSLVGNAIAYETIEGKTYADVEFIAHITDHAKKIFQKARDGFLNATSVGFGVDDYISKSDKPNHDYFKKFPGADYIFTKTELREFSLVTIPANQEAVKSKMLQHHLGKAKQSISHTEPTADISDVENKQAELEEALNTLKELNNE